MKWYYTCDSMPEKNKECLVVTNWADGTRHIEIDYVNDCGYWGNNIHNRTGFVTHWMPLPDLPKED